MDRIGKEIKREREEGGGYCHVITSLVGRVYVLQITITLPAILFVECMK